jgi:hypothetical protein
VIDSVQGRSEDVLHLPAVNGGELPVQPLTFHRVLDSLSVSGWQIVQDADRLCVLIGTSSNSRVNNVSDEVLISALAEALAAQGVKVPPILVQHVNVVPKNASGKAPLIKVNRPEHRDR